MKILPLFASAAVLLTGCYSARYIPYSGTQKEWPTDSGAFLEQTYAIPIFYGFPSKPYVYLGKIKVQAQSTIVNAAQVAALEAKKRGADALVIIEEGDRYGGSVGGGNATSFGRNGVTTGGGWGGSVAAYFENADAVAIKFKDPRDVPPTFPAPKAPPVAPVREREPQ